TRKPQSSASAVSLNEDPNPLAFSFVASKSPNILNRKGKRRTMIRHVRPQRGEGNRGFTLIELLVVIAIIAILAAILFPVFAKAGEKARQSSCLSNVKQLNLGMQMYAQDYDERFPVWAWWASYSPGGAVPARINHFESLWVNAIYPYVKNNQIYECPDT